MKSGQAIVLSIAFLLTITVSSLSVAGDLNPYKGRQHRAEAFKFAQRPKIEKRLPERESLGVNIDTYGVMMLLARTGGRDFRCYLYKHKPVFSAGR